MRPIFFVFCEGETEVAYVNYLKSKYRLPIQIVPKKSDSNISCRYIENCKRALILGTGGASKAVQHVLRTQGIEYKCVSRSSERGDITYDELTPEIIAQHTLIINATPVGMHPDVAQAPDISYEHIGPEHRLFDLVYNPANTEFLRRAKERGAMTMGGMLMLQTQAIASWHVWRKAEEHTK